MARTSHQWMIAAVLLVGGMLIGVAATTSNVAHGEVRPVPQPQSFQTGGQLSLPVLKDIAATLHQIDARLARFEAMVGKAESAKK